MGEAQTCLLSIFAGVEPLTSSVSRLPHSSLSARFWASARGLVFGALSDLATCCSSFSSSSWLLALVACAMICFWESEVQGLGFGSRAWEAGSGRMADVVLGSQSIMTLSEGARIRCYTSWATRGRLPCKLGDMLLIGSSYVTLLACAVALTLLACAMAPTMMVSAVAPSVVVWSPARPLLAFAAAPTMMVSGGLMSAGLILLRRIACNRARFLKAS